MQVIDSSRDQSQSEVITSTNLDDVISVKKEEERLNIDKEKGLKKSIIKSAKFCARKFENKSKRKYFSTYCIKKAQRLIQDEPVPKPEEVASMQKVVDVFNKNVLQQ